jgi:hypothetical protein
MASFGGYSDPADPIEKIVQLAMLRFGVHNLQVSLKYGTKGPDAVLVDENGREYPLRGLIAHAMQVPPNSDQFYQAIMSHADAIATGAPPPPVFPGNPPPQYALDEAPQFPPPSLTGGMPGPFPGVPPASALQGPPPDSPFTGPLSTPPFNFAPPTNPAANPFTGATPVSPFSGAPQAPASTGELPPAFSAPPPPAPLPPPPPVPSDPLMAVVRVRLVPDTLLESVSLQYARPFSSGLVSVLSVHNNPGGPFLTDDALQGKDIDALYNAGYGNLMGEQFDAVSDVAPGVRLFAGDSPFTASKAIGMSLLVGRDLPPAPYGVVFGVPHQHLLYVHVVTGKELIHAVNALATLVVSNATPDVPGGVLSNLTYFWNGGVVEPIGFPNTEGKVQIVATGAFGQMVNEVMR